MTAAFDDAVAFARAQLKSTPWLTPEGGRKVILTMFRHLRVQGGGQQDLTERLVQQAPGNFELHQLLCDFAAHLLEKGSPLPKHVQAYIVGMLRGQIIPPTRRRGGQRTVTRDLAVQLVLYELVTQWGMNATTNEVGEERSACDVVSKALSQIEINIKPAAVAKIWTRRYLVDDFEAFAGIRNE